MRFLPVKRIKEIHSDLIADYGGTPGLRDEGLLESAALRARHRVRYERNGSVATADASMSYGLIKNHPFIDGTNGLGLRALIIFLKANG